MGSYFGAETSTKQNEIRRATKKRRAAGRKGVKAGENQLEDVRIRRHVVGTWAPTTVEAIRNETIAYPDRPINTRFFKGLMRDSGVVLTINEEGHELDGREVVITNDEIRSDVGLELYSVTVRIDSTFGFRFNKDRKTGRVYCS